MNALEQALDILGECTEAIHLKQYVKELEAEVDREKELNVTQTDVIKRQKRIIDNLTKGV
jgi:hypothetical protein